MTGIIAQLGKISSVTPKYAKGGKYNFPSQEKIPPKEKLTPEYQIQTCQAVYSALVRDKTAFNMSQYSYMQTLRDYGTGSQAEELYYNLTPNKDSTNADTSTDTLSAMTRSKRKNMDSISANIISIATNLSNGIHGMFDEYEEDIYVNSIDNESGAEVESAMFEALFDAKMSPFTKSLNNVYGIPVDNNAGLPLDTTIQELEIYKDSGGFKTFWAENMEETIKHTEQISNWNRTIKRKFIDDMKDLNFIVAESKYDFTKRKEVWEYVNPQDFFSQYSLDKNFEDSEYAGVVRIEKISELVERGFDSEELIKAAAKYKDAFDNPYVKDWGQYEDNQLDNQLLDFRVPVLHLRWIECDMVLNKKITNNFGISNIVKKPIGSKIEAAKEGYTIDVYPTRMRRLYQCSWVVDTNMIYDYGLTPNQGEPRLPFAVYRGVTTNKRMVFGSIIESIVPFLDHLQLSWLKYQDIITKFHPGGYKVNLRLLQNLKMGSRMLEPIEAYNMYWETNVFPYMDVPIGENYKGGDVTPISRIEGTPTDGITVFQNEIAFISQMIEKLTGINPVTMGATPKDVTATATNMAVGGTSNVLRPMITGIFEVKEGLADRSSKRVPLLMRNVKDSANEYAKVIGKEGVDVLVKAESLGAQYGLYMEARPTNEERADLIAMLEQAMQRGRDGEASINLGQAFYIKERINACGNFKKLRRQVEFMVRKSEEQMFERKRQLIQEQTQQNLQATQAAEQAKMQTAQMQAKIDIELDSAKTNNLMLLKKQEYELEIKKEVVIKALEENGGGLQKTT